MMKQHGVAFSARPRSNSRACTCGTGGRLRVLGQSEVQWNRAQRGGHARGKFVHTSASGAELDREALGRWPRGAHGCASA
jgi:hypothetical protein